MGTESAPGPEAATPASFQSCSREGLQLGARRDSVGSTGAAGTMWLHTRSVPGHVQLLLELRAWKRLSGPKQAPSKVLPTGQLSVSETKLSSRGHCPQNAPLWPAIAAHDSCAQLSGLPSPDTGRRSPGLLAPAPLAVASAAPQGDPFPNLVGRSQSYRAVWAWACLQRTRRAAVLGESLSLSPACRSLSPPDYWLYRQHQGRLQPVGPSRVPGSRNPRLGVGSHRWREAGDLRGQEPTKPEEKGSARLWGEGQP